ncbi:MAG TPA: hypothetical protein DCY94_04135 [Firmicutes bacterium]|nr:hypothetical protein [Bacillota bacterium]
MSEQTFVNDFISIGMTEYFTRKTATTFESHIVECLADIYGYDNLKSAYDSKNEGNFATLLHRYGLSRTTFDNFLRDTIKYESFKEENKKDPSVKSDLASKIESHIITMFLYKCLLIEPSLEEISHFENDLLNNFAMIKHHFNTSLNPNKTRETWEKKKKMLEDSVELIEIKPKYLDAFTYAKYGTSLEEVKKMDYRMVEELNNYIESKEAETPIVAPKRMPNKKGSRLLRDTAISSGNGYVDALLIAGIIATEMSIGLIYLFLHF